jgi:tetratricopeptide (TPR) repeat protein
MTKLYQVKLFKQMVILITVLLFNSFKSYSQTENVDLNQLNLKNVDAEKYKNVFISLFNSLKNKNFDNFYENHKNLFFVGRADSAGTKRSIDYHISRDTTSSFYKLYKFGKSQGINWKNIDTTSIYINIDTSLDFIKVMFNYNNSTYVMHTYYMLNLMTFSYDKDSIFYLPEVFVTYQASKYWEGLMRLQKQYEFDEINEIDFYNEAIQYYENNLWLLPKKDLVSLNYLGWSNGYWHYYDGRYKKLFTNDFNDFSSVFYKRRGEYWQHNQKEYFSAIKDYTSFIELSKVKEDLASVYLKRGWCKLKLEDYYGTITDCNQSINNSTKENQAYFLRGCAKFSLKNYISALDDFNKYILDNPKDEEAYYNRGCIKFELKNIKGGCIDWSKAGELGYEEAYDKIKKYCK